MNHKTIRLLALDMDDTLLDDNFTISPRTIEAIRRTIEQGVIVTIATGRMYQSALPFARQLGLDVPIITYNGALIKSSMSEETQYFQPIESEVATAALAFFRERGWYVQTYVDDILYVKERTEEALYYEHIANVQAVAVGEKLYDMTENIIKMLAVAEPDQIFAVRDAIKERFGDKLYVARSKERYLEMVHSTVNKGVALDFFAKRMGIDRMQVMAVGDSMNDLDMLEYAGFGVAMGNAAPSVKAVADAVTLANSEDGVAEAIERYILIKK